MGRVTSVFSLVPIWNQTKIRRLGLYWRNKVPQVRLDQPEPQGSKEPPASLDRKDLRELLAQPDHKERPGHKV